MEESEKTEIEQLRGQITQLKESVDKLIYILMRVGTELRNSKDRGAFHAGNYLGGVIEGMRADKKLIDFDSSKKS